MGAYQALLELGWTPQIITGASVGCLNAALFVTGQEDAAAELWKSLDNRSVLAMPESQTREELREFLMDTLRAGGLNTEPLGQTIDRYLDESAVRHSPIRYGLVMTEMNNLRSIQCPIEEIPEGRLREYMLASSACFPALRPIEIDGVKYIDGGWRDNMPLELAASMGATELIGVDVDGVGYTRPNTTGLPTRIIRSHWDLGPLFDFDGERAAKNIFLGYLDTMREFGRLGGTAYGIMPAQDGFLERFAREYHSQLTAAIQRAPRLTSSPVFSGSPVLGGAAGSVWAGRARRFFFLLLLTGRLQTKIHDRAGPAAPSWLRSGNRPIAGRGRHPPPLRTAPGKPPARWRCSGQGHGGRGFPSRPSSDRPGYRGG